MFGLNIPDQLKANRAEPIRYWGARAIFQDRQIDLLPDRMTFRGKDHDEKLEPAERKLLPFIWWLDHSGLPWLREAARQLSPDSSEVIHRCDHSFLIAASPQRSYGYLYIGAVEFPVDGCEYDLPEFPRSGKWSGDFEPHLRDRVAININRLGTGRIVSFFVEHGWAGVRVKLDNQPEWHRKQGQPPCALVFGQEVRRLS